MKHLATVILICFSGIFNAQPCDIPPSSLDCEGAPILCIIDDLDGYCTTLPKFVNATGPNPLCSTKGGGTPNNTIWFGFVAGSTTMAITVIPSNCTSVGGFIGIQGGIYSGSAGCDNLKELVCQGNCSTGPVTFSSSGFSIGEIYYILLDGCNLSVCDVTIDVLTGNIGTPLLTLNSINGPDYVCIGGSYQYSIPESITADFWYWTLDSMLLLDPSIATNKINILFDTVGIRNVCIDVANFCYDVNEAPIQKCKQVVVFDESFPLIEKDILICSGDSILFKGTYYKDGEGYLDTIAVGQGCEGVISNMVTNYISPVKDLGDIFICEGECFSISVPGMAPLVYCDTISNAQIVIPNYLGCDSLINFNLRKGFAKSDTLVQSKLLCYKDTIEIGNLKISSPGQYTYINNLADSCQVVELEAIDNTKAPDIDFGICDNITISYNNEVFGDPGIFQTILNIGSCKQLQNVIISNFPSYPGFPCIDIETTIPIVINGILVSSSTILKVPYLTVNGCDSIVCYDITFTVAANDQSKVIDINLLPNPTKNQLQITADIPLAIDDWQVYNTLGQQVLQSNKNEFSPILIDVSSLNNGLYYWKGLVNGQQVTRQFMKIE